MLIALALVLANAAAVPAAATIPAADLGLVDLEGMSTSPATSPLLPPAELPIALPPPANGPPVASLEAPPNVHLRVALAVAVARVSACPQAENRIRGSRAVGSVQLFGNTSLRCEPAPGDREFRNRYFDPKTGRFVTADPLGYVDGPNMYQGFLNSPLNYGDPLGLNTFDCGVEENCERMQAALARALAAPPGARLSEVLPYAEDAPLTDVYNSYRSYIVDPSVPWHLRAANIPNTLIYLAASQLEQAGKEFFNAPHNTAVNFEMGAEVGRRSQALIDQGADPIEARMQAEIDVYGSVQVLGPGIAAVPFGPGSFGRNLGRNISRRMPTPELKSSPFGPKIADPIPAHGVPANWSREQIADAIVDYRASLASRKAELVAFDSVGAGSATQRLAHARRITQEEDFLRSLEKAYETRP